MFGHLFCKCHYLNNIPAMKYIQKRINGKQQSMKFTSNPFEFLNSIPGDTTAE
jgi:hypothetical protein